MDHKICTNAAISYAPVLWELFLLAHNNPNFNNYFIRNHAKNATKIHFSFLAIISIYKYFIEGFLYIYIPIINISIHEIIQTSIFFIFTFLLIRWAYKAHKWIEVEEIKIKRDYLKLETETLDKDLSEAQKMIYIASYIPFIWLIIAAKHNSPINRFWAKISWIFSIIMVFFIIFNHPELLGMAMLLYIWLAVTAWVMMFLHQKIIFSSFLEVVPDLETSYALIRAWSIYFIESIKVIFGKKEEISFQLIYDKILEKDEKFYNLANTHLTSTSIAFSNKLIYIPWINLIFLPKYFLDRKSKYTLAIIQWIIITIILALIIYLEWNIYSPYATILIFPIFLGIANIDSNPFYKIPIIYEIYIIFDYLSFWMFSKMKFIKEKNSTIKEMSFKI